MKNNQNPPINFSPAYDLQQKQIQIIPEFTEKETNNILGIFNVADSLHDFLLQSGRNKYPFPVHCIALPQFSSSCWLQGVSVQRIVDQSGLKTPVTDSCLELTRTKDPVSGIMYIAISSVIYLAERNVEGIFSSIVLINNILSHYAKKV